MDWIIVIAIAWAAGLAMPIGALVAQFENIQPKWLEKEFRHSVIAFGGGALLSAVALVLVPEGSKPFGPIVANLWLLLGAVALMGLDIFLSKKNPHWGNSSRCSPTSSPKPLHWGPRSQKEPLRATSSRS